MIQDLRRKANPTKTKGLAKFFKTGPGQYGEGDVFIGLTVPEVRAVAKKYADAPLDDLRRLLADKIHEVRMLGLMILVRQYECGDVAKKKIIVDFYREHVDRINNWDLVDLTAYKILGDFLITRDRAVLKKLAKTNHLWTQRIAIVSTYAFIREGQFDDTLSIAQILLTHPHDLIHKAVGWMLREVGKRDQAVLRKFLDRFAAEMPRTMLRYAIEKMDVAMRKHYMAL